MKSVDQETIIAQCTPQGSGALALLRMSGDDALAIASKMSTLASGIPLHAVHSHTVHYGWVHDQKKSEIDQVLFIVMHGPRTFTGQDVVEITCHNNPFLIEAVIQQAISHGARLAQEGEFTKRAFMHGKIDLLQAEALNELINANTQASLKQALAQLEGSFSHWITQLEKELIKNLAFSDASFEFSDEEMEFGTQITTSIQKVLSDLAIIKQTFNQQQQIRQGIKIALIGSVNAGKSSLFNALLQQNRAIVTNIAGTTRDAIEAGVYEDGFYLTFIDTAGLRETNDLIEQEGIKRSFHEAHAADIILLVFDRSRQLTQQEYEIYQKIAQQHAQKIIFIANKCDLPNNIQKDLFSGSYSFLEISTNNQETIKQIKITLKKKIADLFAHLESPFLLNQRQFNVLLTLEKKLLALLPLLQQKTIDYEIISYHLKEALEQLTTLSGKTISEQGMDAIFREFCIGK